MPRIHPRTALRHHRDEALCRRFRQLYERDRLRLDDCYRRLAREFFLAERTVSRILKHAAPDEAPATTPLSNPQSPAATPHVHVAR